MLLELNRNTCDLLTGNLFLIYRSYDSRVIDLVTGLGYKMIMWNLDTNDWQTQADIESNLQTFVQGMPDYSVQSKSWIALMHDTYRHTLQSQDLIIPYIKDLEYKFVKVNECFHDDKPYFD